METYPPDSPATPKYQTQPYEAPAYSRITMVVIILVGLGIIGAWLINTPAGVSGKADAVGYAICHRISDRSFHAFGQQLPLCARCSGIYLGAATALGVFAASGRAKSAFIPNIKVLGALILFVTVMGVDGLNSYFHLFPNFENGLYEPHNTLRTLTGMLFGITFISLLLPMFNAAMWRKMEKRAPIGNLKELAGVVLVAFLVTFSFLLEIPILLLTLGVISAFTVLLMLTMIFTVFVVTFLRRDSSYSRWGELWLPALGGLTAAIALVGAIDLVRYSLTGTWDGFIF